MAKQSPHCKMGMSATYCSMVNELAMVVEASAYESQLLIGIQLLYPHSKMLWF